MIYPWLPAGQESVHSILLTHIPLHRPLGSDCGPTRERGTIRAGKGIGYQNTLSPEMSEFLAERIHPVLVFRYAPIMRVAPKNRYLTLLVPITAAMTTITASSNTNGAPAKLLSSHFQWLWGSESPGFSSSQSLKMMEAAPAQSTNCARCLTRSGSISRATSPLSHSRWG